MMGGGVALFDHVFGGSTLDLTGTSGLYLGPCCLYLCDALVGNRLCSLYSTCYTNLYSLSPTVCSCGCPSVPQD